MGSYGEGLSGDGTTGSETHLDSQRDVCIGTEAPTTVTGAVVEAATCGKADSGAGQSQVQWLLPSLHAAPTTSWWDSRLAK